MFHKINMEWQQKAISRGQETFLQRRIYTKNTNVKESAHTNTGHLHKNLQEFVNIIIFIVLHTK